MARTFQGDVSFLLHDQPSPHRFEVCISEDHKVILWLEDRQSKKQWQTDALTTKDFVNEDNAIPKAKLEDYAKRFAACLGATGSAIHYGRELSVKGGEHILLLTLPFQWASCDLALEYKFVMKEVPLERIDILGARVRDLEDKALLVGENRHLAPVFVQATTNSNHAPNQTLVWVAGPSDGGDVIEFLPKGLILFRSAGVFAVDVGVIHTSTTNGAVFELKRSDITVATCQSYSSGGYTNDLYHPMNQHRKSHVEGGFFGTSPMRYILKVQSDDKLSVVYKGSNNALPGSYITIVRL